MKTKYEIIEVEQTEITVDVSLLSKTEEMFFNATQMAKPFGKSPKDFLKTGPTKDYIDEIFKEDLNPIKNIDDLVRVKRGKYGGTWFHNELAFEFAGWCSAVFRRRLHKWAEERIKKEADWKKERLESKTGYLPMTEAVQNDHDPVKFYHFKIEADMLNDIVVGMNAKKFKAENGVTSVRDACTAEQLYWFKQLQEFNTHLINIGLAYKTRKEILTRYRNGEDIFLGEVA